MLCATISLPVPLSPVTSTLASDRAIRSISCWSAVISGLLPMSRTKTLGVGVTAGTSSSLRGPLGNRRTPIGQVLPRRKNDGLLGVASGGHTRHAQRGGHRVFFQAERAPKPLAHDGHIGLRSAREQHADLAVGNRTRQISAAQTRPNFGHPALEQC